LRRWTILWSPRKLGSPKRLQIRSLRVLVPALAAPILSAMSKGLQLRIQFRLEVEMVGMVEEVEVELEVDLPAEAEFWVLLGVRALLIWIGPLRTSCMQCPRLLAKASEML
jgi:hypothetical protein